MGNANGRCRNDESRDVAPQQPSYIGAQNTEIRIIPSNVPPLGVDLLEGTTDMIIAASINKFTLLPIQLDVAAAFVYMVKALESFSGVRKVEQMATFQADLFAALVANEIEDEWLFAMRVYAHLVKDVNTDVFSSLVNGHFLHNRKAQASLFTLSSPGARKQLKSSRDVTAMFKDLVRLETAITEDGPTQLFEVRDGDVLDLYTQFVRQTLRDSDVLDPSSFPFAQTIGPHMVLGLRFVEKQAGGDHIGLLLHLTRTGRLAGVTGGISTTGFPDGLTLVANQQNADSNVYQLNDSVVSGPLALDLELVLMDAEVTTTLFPMVTGTSVASALFHVGLLRNGSSVRMTFLDSTDTHIVQITEPSGILLVDHPMQDNVQVGMVTQTLLSVYALHTYASLIHTRAFGDALHVIPTRTVPIFIVPSPSSLTHNDNNENDNDNDEKDEDASDLIRDIIEQQRLEQDEDERLRVLEISAPANALGSNESIVYETPNTSHKLNLTQFERARPMNDIARESMLRFLAIFTNVHNQFMSVRRQVSGRTTSLMDFDTVFSPDLEGVTLERMIYDILIGGLFSGNDEDLFLRSRLQRWLSASPRATGYFQRYISDTKVIRAVPTSVLTVIPTTSLIPTVTGMATFDLSPMDVEVLKGVLFVDMLQDTDPLEWAGVHLACIDMLPVLLELVGSHLDKTTSSLLWPLFAAMGKAFSDGFLSVLLKTQRLFVREGLGIVDLSVGLSNPKLERVSIQLQSYLLNWDSELQLVVDILAVLGAPSTAYTIPIATAVDLRVGQIEGASFVFDHINNAHAFHPLEIKVVAPPGQRIGMELSPAKTRMEIMTHCERVRYFALQAIHDAQKRKVTSIRNKRIFANLCVEQAAPTITIGQLGNTYECGLCVTIDDE